MLVLTVNAARGASAPPTPVDAILIEKSARKMSLWRQGEAVGTYRVALGFEPVGPKTRRGDGRTPEGHYVIDSRNPNSAFHLALHISYPNATDRKRAAQAGVDPGGDIMIHGLKNGFGRLGAAHRLFDWTLGCVAVTDDEIEEIWSLVADGTPVEIRP